MGKLIYLLNASFDGYVEGPDGRFDWGVPDEALHRFLNQQATAIDATLYGRRMYETMAGWETLDQAPDTPEVMREFARIWRAMPKLVFSQTLQQVGPNCRLIRGDIATALEEIKREFSGDLAVSGPTRAEAFARLGLIDAYRLVILPVLVGGGRSSFPQAQQQVPLSLLETRTFVSGAVYLRYARRR